MRILALAAGLLVALWTTEAGACTDAEMAWIAAAAHDTGLQLSADLCSPTVVVLKARTGDGSPLTIEIAAPPGPAFRRAGGLRVSPVAEISDWSATPAATRAAFDSLAAWLEENSALTGLARETQGPAAPPTAPGQRPHVPLPWLPLIALALVAPTLRRPRRRDVAAAVVVFSVAWALRVAFGLYLPLHANGQGALWIRAAYDNPTLLASYGPGYPELYGWLTRVFDGRPDLAIFRANVLVSAVLPVATYALGLALAATRPQALLAALMVAVDPVGVRTAATEVYLVPLATLTALAALSACRAVTAGLQGRLFAAGARTLAAGLLAGQAIRVHPVSLAAIAVVPLVVIAAALATGEPARRALRAAGAAVAIAGAVGAALTLDLVAKSGLQGAGAVGAAMVSLSRYPLAMVTVAVVVVLLGLAARRARPRGAAVAGIAAMALTTAIHLTYAETQLFQASADRLLAPMIALGVAGLLPPRRMVPWAQAAAVAFVSILVLDTYWAPLRTLNTEQREYAWLTEHLADVPPGCRLAHPRRAGMRVLEIPDYATPDRQPAIGVATAAAMRALVLGNVCVVWAHTSLCTPRRGQQVCSDVESALPSTRIAWTTLPAIQSFWQVYERGTVEIGLLQMGAREAAPPPPPVQ